MAIVIPEKLLATCREDPDDLAWLEALPTVIAELQDRWALSLGAPFEIDLTLSWVAPAVRQDGTHAIFKIGMPHMEGLHEIQGLRFWAGNGVVNLLEADIGHNAMLLERCEPGTHLRRLPEVEQDVVIAGLLRRIWREPSKLDSFRPLAVMTVYWSIEVLAKKDQWQDVGLVHAGLNLFEELPRSASQHVLLATDLHAGNVLQAQREPWLVIDPKPFVGDPAYDATQHLLNCEERLRADPAGTIGRFGELLELDAQRIRLWLFARIATEFYDADSIALARMLRI